MIQVNIQEAKTHLARDLNAVEKGDVVILCRHNKPIAELRASPAEPEKRKLPVFGRWEGFKIPDSAFFDPLPDDLLRAFNGE